MYIAIAMVTIVPTKPRTRPMIRPRKCYCTAKQGGRASNHSSGAGDDLGRSFRGASAGVGMANGLRNGDPGGSRTPNPQPRRLMLYPVELRGRPPEVSHSEPAESILHRSQPRMPTEICRAL